MRASTSGGDNLPNRGEGWIPAARHDEQWNLVFPYHFELLRQLFSRRDPEASETLTHALPLSGIASSSDFRRYVHQFCEGLHSRRR